MMIPHHSPPVAGTLRCRLASGGERPQGWHLCETCIAMPTISDIAAKTSSWGGFISQFQWQCFIHGRYDNSPGSMKPADFHLRHENRLEDKSSLFPSLFIIYSHQSPLFSIIGLIQVRLLWISYVNQLLSTYVGKTQVTTQKNNNMIIIWLYIWLYIWWLFMIIYIYDYNIWL